MNKKLILLIVLVIFCMLFLKTEKSYAKYSSEIEGSVLIHAARAITENNRDASFSFKLNDMVPGDTKNYNFNVTNFIGEDITGVTMNYKISVVFSKNIPIDVKLYKNDGITNVLNTDFESDNNILGHTNKQIDNYRLELTWDSEKASTIYAGLTDYIDIYINSKQVLSTD